MSVAYEIGPFRLDPEAGVLSRDGAPTALGGRAVAVLKTLVEHANEFVAKARILDAAWPNLVVEEANLAVQIGAIRRVLAKAGGERWIETLAGRGYRFVGPVTKLQIDPAPDVGRRAQRSNLPKPLTSFVGREREVAQIRVLLSGSRLVTLTGSGGVGKTRLALRVATELVDSYQNGVWLVELSALADPALVPQTAAIVLGLKEQQGKSLTETLIEHLRSKHVLLVLDNAEHLLAACAQLTDALLRQCAQVVVLATSRQPLAVPGELTYRVPSLSTPQAVRDATALNVAEYESVRLFDERARLHVPQFAVTDLSAPALASICMHLGGIPLAIELAAARVRSMSVEEVNQRLDQRFRLLTGGSRTAPRRQQTLRALVDWSYDLLSATEQALLCRLSVFAGGWALEAAEQVCSGDSIEEQTVLDLLTSLVDKSLVVAEVRNAATRYTLLDTVRQYAWDRLQESGDESTWQRRHLAHFLVMAEEAESQLKGADQAAWLDRLEVEHDNMRSALAWSSARGGDAVGGLRLGGALWRFWLTRGYFAEGRGWLSGPLAATLDEKVGAVRAKALTAAGSLAQNQGDYPAARALLEESLAIREKLGDRRGAASARQSLGIVASHHGDYEAARALFEESLAICRELNDRSGIANSLMNLGTVCDDYEAARALFEESLAICRELGDPTGISHSLINLGEVAHIQGDDSAARPLFEESLALWRQLGHRSGIAHSLINLGAVAHDRGDYLGAQAQYGEGLVILQELGHQRGIAGSLEGIAAVASSLGERGRAARIWGAAERLREDASAPLPRTERPPYERQVAAARTAMGDRPAFDSAWREGRAMTIEQAIGYALAGPDARSRVNRAE